MKRSDAEQMDRDDPLALMRSEFDLIDSDAVYMDGNSLGRPPRGVREAISATVEEWARDLVRGWNRWIDLPLAVGDRLGGLLGAANGQIAVCDSTTVNFYKALSAALDARPGRTSIVGDADDFPTDRYVLQEAATRRGRQLRMVAGHPIDGLALDQLEAVVDDSTAVVCLSQVNYRSGARLDVRSVTELAHRHGALIIWDLCHSGGAVPVGLDEAEVDLAVGCTYKYLNSGPGAPGYLYVNRAVQADLHQPIWGWFGQQDQFAMGPQYRSSAGVGGFLTGTPSIIGIRAVDAAISVTERAGIDRLWAKSQALTTLMTSLIEAELVPLGASLASPKLAARRGAHVSVSHPSAWPWCSALVERQLVIGDFRAPDVIRLGPAPLYTRFVDAYDAVQRMAEVLASGPLGTGEPSRVT
jgi:kynureninase